jgi:hypothetical protein
VKALAANATEIDTDASTSYVDLKVFVPRDNAQVIPKEKVGEVSPWVHIAISNTKRQILNTFHKVSIFFHALICVNLLNLCYLCAKRLFLQTEKLKICYGNRI